MMNTAKTPTIVVIDDDAVTLKVMAVVLNSEEVNLRVAENAKVGAEIVKNENPRLIILDINMPDVDGLTMLADLRRNPATKNTPVLMLTGEERFKAAGLAFDLGASAYMTKPFKPEALREKIASLLKR